MGLKYQKIARWLTPSLRTIIALRFFHINQVVFRNGGCKIKLIIRKNLIRKFKIWSIGVKIWIMINTCLNGFNCLHPTPVKTMLFNKSERFLGVMI